MYQYLIRIRSVLINLQAIPISNRVALLGDALNLARAGDLSYTTSLNLTRYLPEERHYVPWLTATKALGYIKLMLSRASAYGDFEVSVTKLIPA